MPPDSGLILSPAAPLTGEVPRIQKGAEHFSRQTYAAKTRRPSG